MPLRAYAPAEPLIDRRHLFGCYGRTVCQNSGVLSNEDGNPITDEDLPITSSPPNNAG
jgi:hypothetical protein